MNLSCKPSHNRIHNFQTNNQLQLDPRDEKVQIKFESKVYE